MPDRIFHRLITVLCIIIELDLDLVPPVPVWTQNDGLSPSGTTIRNCFGIIPVDFHFFQSFFKCLLNNHQNGSSYH